MNEIIKELKAAGIRVKYDDSDNARPGWKFAEYEMKGVPVRIALGARDLENNVAGSSTQGRENKIKPVTGRPFRPDRAVAGRYPAEYV